MYAAETKVKSIQLDRLAIETIPMHIRCHASFYRMHHVISQGNLAA